MSMIELPVLSLLQLRAALQERLEANPCPTRVVCFDFFDTLVSRTVIPEETKIIAARRLADTMAAGITGDFIYQLRRVLEQRLCAENHAQGLDPEFSLPVLAQRLHAVLGGLLGESVVPPAESFVALVMSIELAVEKQLQILNRGVVELMRYCRSKDMPIAVVSDFYLPAEYFEHLLRHHGLTELVDRLFISADFSVTKGHSGRLYDIVVEGFGCAPEAIVMVGDNVHADGAMARQRGLAACCLQKTGMPAEEKKIQPVEVATGRSEKVFAEVFAGLKARAGFFPEMGLSLYSFIHNLFEQAIRDRRDTLFFCSKEGEFLRQLFIRYQEIRFGRQVIASRYLVVSRKATYICSCRLLGDEDFSRLFVHYRDISLLEFLQSLNFSEAQSRALCAELRLEPLARRHNLQAHPDFRALLGSALFRTSYETHRESQRRNFFLYLASFGCDFVRDGLALVDVGWKGSIQNNIYFALEGKARVSGYYIGLLSPTDLHGNNEKKGILFSDVPVHSPFIHVFNNNRSLFEIVLGASHGSADGYFSRKEWDTLAYPRQSGFFHDGEGEQPYATVLDLPEERQLFERRIRPLQQAYFQIVEQLTEAMTTLDRPPGCEWFARRHARMLFQPTREEVDFFAGLYHLENYGLFEFTTFAGNGRIPMRQRLENFRKLWKDPAGILETGIWPPIIFRRLGLSWLQPVDGIKRYHRIFKGQR